MKKKLSSMDTEATGLDTFHGCRPWLVTACDGKKNYWWEGNVNPQTRDVYWEPNELKDLQLYINSCEEMVFQNLNFDKRQLETIGIYLPQPLIHDTLVSGHLVCSGDVHGLKECSKKYCNYWNDDEEAAERDVVSIRSKLQHNNPTNIAYAKAGHPHFPAETKTSWKQDLWLTAGTGKRYGCIDGERTYLLHKVYTSYLHQNKLYPIYLERLRLLPVLYRMQTVGIHVYRDKILRLIKEYTIQQQQLVRLIKESANCPYAIDPAKPGDLKILLYSILGLEEIDTTDTGQASTSEETLTKLEEIHDSVETIRYLKSWRKITKVLAETTALAIHSDIDNRVHSTINLTGTKWTRFSSSSPNQQNFNKKLKFLFGPPKGYYHLYMDVVNIELRIWAYDVGSKELIDLFESGESVHMLIARALYPEMIERLGEKEFKNTHAYTKCKAGTFTRLNGGGKWKVEQTYGVSNSCAIIDQRCPEIGKYFHMLNEVCVANTERFDYPTYFTMTGYKLEVPLDKVYKVLSARIQGTAGHMVQQMMLDLVKHPVYLNPLGGPSLEAYNKEHPLLSLTPETTWRFPTQPINQLPPCELIQQVHDSLKIEIPVHDHSDYTNKMLVACTERAGERTIRTCPMDFEVIEYSGDDEPIFKDFTFVPEMVNGYEIEMFIHNHKYLCTGTYDKDTAVHAYGDTKAEAVQQVMNLINQGIPF